MIQVGDPQEANAICQVFCSNRTEPLLIGSVKSNMGHAEPASGLCSIAKVRDMKPLGNINSMIQILLSIERRQIPPNLHFETPNQYIPGLVDGRLKVVTEPTPIHDGAIIGINSFGFGGSNTHVVLKVTDHLAKEHPKPSFPKILTYSGRTKEAISNVFDNVEKHMDNTHLQSLLANQANMPAKDCPYRGYMIMYRDGEGPLKDIQKVSQMKKDREIYSKFQVSITEPRPVYFIYSGMGSQWPGMAQKLMCIPLFDNSLRESSKVFQLRIRYY